MVDQISMLYRDTDGILGVERYASKEFPDDMKGLLQMDIMLRESTQREIRLKERIKTLSERGDFGSF
ncbi:hypothetical protein N7449_002377 [Penicillium cf. viridicatum]|uniref:Uncharacterized protein n=1 Tax=Penicillium cf. viridicatum TaxID=2972119 RepID=A0A9W9MV82_9EURO|nr:hypothetical protein N7449_002377 [Penicillium cf. viridicatum]